MTLTDSASPAELDRIRHELHQYNVQHIGEYRYQPIQAMAYEEDAHIAGITGHTGLGWLYVDLFWIHPEHRGKKLGEKLLSHIEAQAKLRNCHSAYLYTYSYQAEGFYLAQGYQVVARLPNFPTGEEKIIMTKSLS